MDVASGGAPAGPSPWLTAQNHTEPALNCAWRRSARSCGVSPGVLGPGAGGVREQKQLELSGGRRGAGDQVRQGRVRRRGRGESAAAKFLLQLPFA